MQLPLAVNPKGFQVKSLRRSQGRKMRWRLGTGVAAIAQGPSLPVNTPTGMHRSGNKLLAVNRSANRTTEKTEGLNEHR